MPAKGVIFLHGNSWKTLMHLEFAQWIWFFLNEEFFKKEFDSLNDKVE